MVSHEQRRTIGTSPHTHELTPVQRRQTTRCRKQTLTAKLSDSGFEEDGVGASSPDSSTDEVLPEVSPLRAEELPAWFLQYGDVGYLTQREKEMNFQPSRSMARQPQLTSEDRCTLVSWLIPVHKHFRLSFECCCLTVNIMDRFLASTAVAADCFQLVGVTALLLSSKMVDVCSPRISQLLSICCDAFTKDQLCNLECLILVRLDFHLAAPTLAFFLDYYTNRMKAAELQREAAGGVDRCSGGQAGPAAAAAARYCSELAQKVCELTLADYAFDKYPPSLIASCALWLACDLLRRKQGLGVCATHSSQEDPWRSLVKHLQGDSTVPAGQESFDHSGAQVQECKENLKLLVSLNKEAIVSLMESSF